MNTLFFGIDNTAYPTAEHIPLIRIHYRDESEPSVRSFLDDLIEYTHIVFMSKHAVYALLRHVDPKALLGKKIISIGKRTAEIAGSFGLEITKTAVEETQEGVLRELNVMDLKNAYIGIPCSSRSRKTVSTLLAYRGIRFAIGYLYDTELRSDIQLPDLAQFNELIFTSPSTIDAFKLHLDTIPKHLQIRFQGEVTKRRFEELFPSS